MTPTPPKKATGNDQVLCIDRVWKRYGTHAVLQGVSLDVKAGEVVALIGASGSGKSTLLKTINLLEQIDDGQIFMRGLDITDPRVDADRVRARIGVVFQQFNLFPHLSVVKNVTLGLRRVHGWDKLSAQQRGLELLDRIGLADKATAYPDRLSGGQQQRVAIVRAVASRPELLLLDEITSALDPELVGEVLELVGELKGSTTIVMATHEMGFARDIADEIVFLDGGVVAESGPPSQILTAPVHERTATFLSRFIDRAP